MLNFNRNLILCVDSYKVSHQSQFPDGLEYTQYYVESRGGKYDAVMLAGVKFLTKLLAKGYKVLHPSYRVCQGDGIDTQEIQRILSWMESKGFSAENVVFGMGGALLQHMDRDTQRFAMKCSAAVIDGEYRPVFKMPKTDPSKASKKGFLDLVNIDDELVTVSTDALPTTEGHPNSVSKCVFLNGEDLTAYTLEDIRELSDQQAK